MGVVATSGQANVVGEHWLLDRERELAAIAAWIEEARGGRGRVALLRASAGLGKTALLDWAACAGESAGLRVLRARGSELEREMPFGVVRQLFEAPLRQLGDTERAAVLHGPAGHTRTLLGLSTDSAGGGDALGVIHGLYWLAANLSDRAPLLLAIDDLHWVDPGTARWLGYLASRLSSLPLLVVAAARVNEPDGEQLVAAVANLPGTVSLTPSPLGIRAVGALISAHFHRVCDERFVQACHTAAGGNPFFVHELLRAAVSDGIEPTGAMAEQVPHLGTREAARSILVRLARLGEPALKLTKAVAILGADAELRHGAALCGMPIGEALRTWDLLAGAEILQSRQPLEFIHPIARSAVYHELPVGERTQAHRRVVALLAADGADPRRIAVHALACQPAGDPEIVGWLRAAAVIAIGAGAPDAAAMYLERVVAEPPLPALRPQVHFELGRALIGRDIARTASVFDGAARCQDLRTRLLALRWKATALAYGLRAGDAIATFDDAIELARANHEPVLHLIATRDFYASWWANDPDRAARHEALMHLADGLEGATAGERAVIAIAALSIAQTGFGTAARALELVEGIRDRLSWDDVEDGIEAVVSLKWVDTLCGDPALAASYEQSEPAHRSRGWIINVGCGRLQRAYAEFRQGALLDAEADARAGWAIVGSLHEAAPSMFWFGLATFVEVLLARGELDEADQLATETGLAQHPSEWTSFPSPPVLCGQLALAHGRIQEGIALLLEAGGWLEERELTNTARVPWRALVAPALAASGRLEEGREIIAPALPQAREFGEPWGLGMALRAAGSVEQGVAGIALLRESVAVLEHSSCRLEHAHARLELGAALRRANRRAEAREHLRSALDLAHRCGAAPLSQRAHEELAATGARPRRVMLSGVESLTASERRVAKLAAEGLSNPEIAQQLFVTRKTVETHLGHVYLKLDITSRARLAAALDQAGAQ